MLGPAAAWDGAGIDSMLTVDASNTHLKYGSSANACWITWMAPGMSASVREITSTAILGSSRDGSEWRRFG